MLELADLSDSSGVAATTLSLAGMLSDALTTGKEILTSTIHQTELYFRGTISLITNGVLGALHRKMTFAEAIQNWFSSFVNGMLSGFIHPLSILGYVVTKAKLNARIVARGGLPAQFHLPTPLSASVAPVAPITTAAPTSAVSVAPLSVTLSRRHWYVVIKGAVPGMYESQ